MTPMVLLLIPYATLVVLHTVLQERLAPKGMSAANEAGSGPATPATAPPPSVVVVIPTYNENPRVLDACCASLVEQDAAGTMRVLLVDDGSSNLDQLLPVYRKYQALPVWTVLISRDGRNHGKRQAQNAAIYGPGRLYTTLEPADLEAPPPPRADFVLMVDSDTVVASDGVHRILAPFADPETASVTGDVGVLNRDCNWLTDLIDERYRLLFRHERAAQSYDTRVFCCAGPFSAYRLKVLDDVWKPYMERTFWGSRCTFGDDLQLTNLMLEQGKRSIYQPRAEAWTIVPTTVRGYLRQQWRWNRSFYRQVRWILPVLRRNPSPYLVLDLLARAAPPLLLGVAIGHASWHLVLLGVSRSIPDLLVIAAMVLIGAAQALWQTRKPRFVLLYGLLYVGLLIPTRIWALCTIGVNGWGTRRPWKASGGATSGRRYRWREWSSRRSRLVRRRLPFFS
jgi:cellulose synthase/poly-beta-1,6-N-acetylglucosamine synthase-like glycosyltransferase